MATSAGTSFLEKWTPVKDAPVVKKFEEKGAVLLGKTNMTELAFGGQNCYSSKVGHSINPYGPHLDTSGSSGGSAIAVAISFANFALATDTAGSIPGPASAQSIVGLVSAFDSFAQGIIPLVREHDTIGSMTKTVRDVASVQSVLDNYNYTEHLNPNSLAGKRIGIIVTKQKTDEVNRLITCLQSKGATVIEIDEDEYKEKAKGFAIMITARGGFQNSLEGYLAKQDNLLRDSNNEPIKTLSQIINFCENDPEAKKRILPELLEKLKKVNIDSTPVEKYPERLVRYKLKAKQALEFCFDKGIDALMMPDSYTLAPSVAGCPRLNIPIGYASNGQPIGSTIVGPPAPPVSSSLEKQQSMQKLLDMGYAIEQNCSRRRPPVIR